MSPIVFLRISNPLTLFSTSSSNALLFNNELSSISSDRDPKHANPAFFVLAPSGKIPLSKEFDGSLNRNLLDSIEEKLGHGKYKVHY